MSTGTLNTSGADQQSSTRAFHCQNTAQPADVSRDSCERILSGKDRSIKVTAQPDPAVVIACPATNKLAPYQGDVFEPDNEPCTTNFQGPGSITPTINVLTRKVTADSDSRFSDSENRVPCCCGSSPSHPPSTADDHFFEKATCNSRRSQPDDVHCCEDVPFNSRQFQSNDVHSSKGVTFNSRESRSYINPSTPTYALIPRSEVLSPRGFDAPQGDAVTNSNNNVASAYNSDSLSDYESPATYNHMNSDPHGGLRKAVDDKPRARQRIEAASAEQTASDRDKSKTFLDSVTSLLGTSFGFSPTSSDKAAYYDQAEMSSARLNQLPGMPASSVYQLPNRGPSAPAHRDRNPDLNRCASPPGKSPSEDHGELSQLLHCISDEALYEKSLRNRGLDLKQMPLGRINKSRIDDAKGILETLEQLIAHKMEISEDPNSAQTLSTYKSPRTEEVNSLSSASTDQKIDKYSQQFRRLVPLSGRKQEEPIGDFRRLKKLVNLLEEMEGVRFSREVLKKEKRISPRQILKPADQDDKREVASALARTHARTHSRYRMTPISVFDCTDCEEWQEHRRSDFHKCQERMLLWHGCPLANWTKILRMGLTIDPDDRVQSAKMFGNGIYFTDIASKAANYCNASVNCPYGVLALAEVALGTPYRRVEADYNAPSSCAARRGGHTWGVGRFEPQEKGRVPMRSVFEGSIVHLNKGHPDSNLRKWLDACTSVSAWMPPEYEKCSSELFESPPEWKTSSLLYNEFVVYNKAQVILRYIVFVQFEFLLKR